jgi:hypothetical protein
MTVFVKGQAIYLGFFYFESTTEKTEACGGHWNERGTPLQFLGGLLGILSLARVYMGSAAVEVPL